MYSSIYLTRCNFTQFIYIWKLLYMFWVVPPPIIRSAYNFIYSIWYLSDCYQPLAAGSSNGVTNTRCCRYSCVHSWWWVEVLLLLAAGSSNGEIPDAVHTVVCTSDDGWRYHPKHVEQFPDTNKLCKVAYCWIYIGLNEFWCVCVHIHSLVFNP
jgi:hypothetical protein